MRMASLTWRPQDYLVPQTEAHNLPQHYHPLYPQQSHKYPRSVHKRCRWQLSHVCQCYAPGLHSFIMASVKIIITGTAHYKNLCFIINIFILLNFTNDILKLRKKSDKYLKIEKKIIVCSAYMGKLFCGSFFAKIAPKQCTVPRAWVAWLWPSLVCLLAPSNSLGLQALLHNQQYFST